MRIGFTVKELSEHLGIDPRRVSQRVDPAFEKVAKLWRVNATKTMQLLMSVVLDQVRAQAYQMPDDEIEQRIAMATGRQDTRVIRAADVATGRAPHPMDERL